MEIDVSQEDEDIIRLKKVYNSVMFENDAGKRLFVCMRDSGFDVGLNVSGTSKGRTVWCHISEEQLILDVFFKNT